MKRMTVLLVSVFIAVTVAAITSVMDTPTAEAAGGGYVQRCGGGKILLNADEKQTFALHNQARKDRNLRSLCVSPKLQQAARAHSRDMIRRDYFSHTIKGTNRDGCDRLRSTGYRFRYCGENIAYGSGSLGEPRNIMRSWMRSAGHRRNILSGKFHEIGVGTYTGTFKRTGNTTMYTADFGTPL